MKVSAVITLFCVALALGSPISAGTAKYPKPPRDEETGKFTYQGVVDVEGVAADDLYGLAKAWVAKTYRSANDVIQLDDPYAGRIIVKGNFPFSVFGAPKLARHTLTIEVRDSRYRYTLTDFVVSSGAGYEVPLEDEKSLTGMRKKSFGTVVSRSVEAIAALEKAMSEPEEDW